jgi:hypothetical protein
MRRRKSLHEHLHLLVCAHSMLLDKPMHDKFLLDTTQQSNHSIAASISNDFALAKSQKSLLCHT